MQYYFLEHKYNFHYMEFLNNNFLLLNVIHLSYFY